MFRDCIGFTIPKISEMLCCGFKQKEDEKDKIIEMSFKLNRSLPKPCACIGLEQHVIRDEMESSRVAGLNTLLDDIDKILEVGRISWTVF